MRAANQTVDRVNSVNAPVTKKQIREDFAKGLAALLQSRGWTQTELSRRASRHLPDGQTIGRDLVSNYVRGQSLPSPGHLNALAKAFDVAPEELLPTRVPALSGAPAAGMAANEDAPLLDVQDAGDGKARLRINQVVPWNVALDILRMLKGE